MPTYRRQNMQRIVTETQKDDLPIQPLVGRTNVSLLFREEPIAVTIETKKARKAESSGPQLLGFQAVKKRYAFVVHCHTNRLENNSPQNDNSDLCHMNKLTKKVKSQIKEPCFNSRNLVSRKGFSGYIQACV